MDILTFQHGVHARDAGARFCGGGRTGWSGAALVAVVASGSIGCDSSRSYTSTVEIIRSSVVRRDASGQPELADAEVRYTSCPGDQREVVRGGAEFASCLAQYTPGAKLPVSLSWYRHHDGHYDWDLLQLGACRLSGAPHSNGSFETVQECEDIKVHGATVGFRCQRLPDKHLLAQCPWFRR